MRLLFLILAHDRPEEAAELARVLAAAGTDARASIHFDRRADPRLFSRLEAAVTGDPRTNLVRDRAAAPWGEWGLVEAPLRALAQAEAEAAATGWTPDRVILLSGACLPCRPVRQLERFLAARPGVEFIESEDASWIRAGLRDDRWRYRFPVNFRAHPRLHRWLTAAQRGLGLARRFPEGLAPRWGSQWWALTWETCRGLTRWRREAAAEVRFFRQVWIPDEMAIQTLVRRLVPAEAIAGRTLTHVQFTDRGVPVVYHDDHAGYVRTLDAFFVRKASPAARRLRADCLAAASAEDGAPVALAGRSAEDYALRLAARRAVARPGRPFRPDQRAPEIDRVLAQGRREVCVLLGPEAATAAVAARLPRESMEVLGHVFAADRVDFGVGRAGLHGLTEADAAIRDTHPALYLMRVLARAGRLPVLRWRPSEAPDLLAALLRDPRATVAVCLPRTGHLPRDLRLMEGAPGSAADPAARERERLAEAAAEERAGAWLREGLRWLVTGPLGLDPDPDAARLALRARLVPMPWAPPGEDRYGPRRELAFRRGLERLALSGPPGAERLAEALAAAWRDPLFAPGRPAPAAIREVA